MLIATGQAPPKRTVWCCWESSAWTAHCAIRRHFADGLRQPRKGIFSVVVPEASAKEASLVDGVEILPFANLAQLAAYLRKEITAADTTSNRR